MKRLSIIVIAVVCLLFFSLSSGEAQSLPPEPPPAEGILETEAPLAVPSASLAAPSISVSAGPPILGGDWTPQGPGPTINAQVQNLNPNNEVSGAIHAVVAHPTNANILYIGAVNGGVWLTTNATAASPTWTQLTDFEQSLSIGALEMDPGNSNILLAGIGRFSSFGGDPPFLVAGGPLSGLLRTIDGGNTWTPITDPLLVGEHISAVASRGNILLAGANDFFGGGGIGGLFRSTDTGGTWAQVSGGAGTGLPGGTVDDLGGDPSNAARLYVALEGDGIYRTDDTGANWLQVSNNDANLNAAMGGSTNTRIAVANTGRVFVLVTRDTNPVGPGVTTYIGYSDDQGATWTQMDVPGTVETALQGRDELMALVVDPVDDDIVYVSAISQRSNNVPPFGMPPGSVPNSVGATSFHAHMFRGDVTQARGLTGNVSNQWDHLTHATGNALMPNGGTANTSSPHADSREMAFDANGNLIEVGDGGVTRRTSPDDNTGDWFSINGDIQITEAHSVAYDTNFDIIIAGTQDTGAVEQTATGSATWDSVRLADGGKVAVDDSTPGTSVRYLSSQNLANFTRRTCNPGCANAFPMLAGAGPAQFYTPLEVNTFDPTRLLLGTQNGLSESLDQGNTANIVPGAGVTANSDAAMVYGHPDNAELIYVGAGFRVFVRTTAGGNLTPTATPFPGGAVFGVAVDPADENVAYVIDNNQVFQTPDGGSTWTDITGNIAAGGAGTFRAIAYIEGDPGNDKLVVGTNAGVMVSVEPHFNAWFELGEELPNAPVWDLDYDVADDLLVAGTLGRGVWTLTDVSLITVPVNTIPGSVVFAGVCNGLTSFATLEVCNTGKADLLVTSIDSSDPQFAVTEPGASGYPVLISPDFCFPFEATFTPTGTGEQTATFTISSNDPAYPEIEVSAIGTSDVPQMTATLQADGNFGSVQVGEPKILNLQVVNQSSLCELGVISLTRSSGDADFSFAGPANGLTLPVVLPIGQAIDLPIQFLPSSFTPPPKSADFTLATDDPNDSPLVFGVSGLSPAPDITVSGTLAFGAVCADNAAPAEQTVQVCNGAGVNNLSVDAELVGTGCGDFSIEGNPFPADLSPDFCIPITVQYTPTGVGDHNDCDLVITSNDPDESPINIPASGSTPAPVINVADDQGFPPTVIQSVDACSSSKPFPIQNNGSCPLRIQSVSISANDAEYSLSGLPSVPVDILPGELFGDGNLKAVFAPDSLARTTTGQLSVTYVTNPITGATDTITRELCGEAVHTGARVLVTYNGVPLDIVKSIKLQRLGPKRNKDRLDTIDNAKNLPLQTVAQDPPCASFQYHREYGTVLNPIQLAPGSYVVTVQARIDGKNKHKTVGFDVSSCDFNPNIVVDF